MRSPSAAFQLMRRVGDEAPLGHEVLFQPNHDIVERTTATADSAGMPLTLIGE